VICLTIFFSSSFCLGNVIGTDCLSFVSQVSTRSATLPGKPKTFKNFEDLSNVKRLSPLQYVNQDLLKKYDLELDTDGVTLYDNQSGGHVKLGALQAVTPKYLFEWAGTNTHKAWVREGGISPGEMDSYLEEPGQSAGKGYYVSSDPLDSITFGTALTVFRPLRPMIILAPVLNSWNSPQTQVPGKPGPAIPPASLPVPSSPTPFDQITKNTDFVKRLRSAGVDGFQVPYKPTWFSIISSDLIQGASGVNQDFVKNGLLKAGPRETLSFVLGTKSKPFVQREIKRAAPKNGLVQKVIEERSLSPRELDAVINAILKNNFSIRITKVGEWDYLDQVLSQYLELQLSQAGPEGLRRALEVAKSFAYDSNTLNLALGRLDKSADPSRKLYGAILDVFDLLDLKAVQNGSALQDFSTIEKLKSVGTKWQEAIAGMDRDKSQSFEELFLATQTVLGEEPKLRSDVVYMGSRDKNSRATYLITNRQAAMVLKSNRLLSSKTIEIKGDPEHVRIYIEYPSILNYKNYRELLPEDLLKELDQLTQEDLVNFDSPKSGALTKKIVEELIADLFDPAFVQKIIAAEMGLSAGMSAGFVDPLSLYRAFISIHPLADGNGRMSRLFFRLFSRSKGLPPGLRLKMSVPLFDLDLFDSPFDLDTFLKFGLIMDNWIARARTDEEFLQRAQEALDQLIVMRPQLESMFPELLRK